MEEVSLLIGGRKPFLTNVWITEFAANKVRGECEDPRALLEKLTGYAQAGFWNLEGEKNAQIRHEVGETFRIRYKSSSLFRLVGFYETVKKRDFIILDAFKKPGDDYTDAQWARMQEISQIKRRGEWRKRLES